jgi:hypothetical protein
MSDMSERDTLRNSSTDDFLIAEFTTAFAHIQKIDDRRLRFAEYLISLHAVLATATVAVITKFRPESTTFKLDGSDAILLWTGAGIALVATIAILSMLNSEREANLRYRRKINHLRGIFLLNEENPEIQRYLSDYASLGTPTHRNEQPTGLGRTLRGIFALSIIFVTVWLIAAGICQVIVIQN